MRTPGGSFSGTMKSQAAAYPAAHATRYRPEIDGLRAIAVSSVILYHAGAWPFGGGYVGVDIFFVISGYLISSIIIADLARGRFSFADFYERRIRRIFPALFLVLAVSSVAAWFVLTPDQLKNFGQSLSSTVLFVSNLYFRWKTSYFNGDTDSSPLIHMWSLSVEEQFYLFFPLALIALRRVRAITLETALWAGFALSLGWCLFRAATDPGGTYFSMPARAWELLAGALVAVNRPRLVVGALVPRWAMPAEWIGIAGIVYGIVAFTKDTVFPGFATLAPVLGSASVLLAATETSPVGRLLALRPMVAVGLVSYSAYLWHQPLFAFLRTNFGGSPGGWGTAGVIAATFALAWASWRFVERPFRARDSVTRRAVFTGAGTLTMLALAGGLALHLSRGVPQRYDAATRALGETMRPSPFRDACHTDGLNYRHPANGCRYFVRNTTWAVLGDSHAIEPAYALAETLRPHGQGLVHLSFSGCQAALTFESNNPGCSAWTREAVDWLVSQRQIADVLIAYRPAVYLFGDQTHSWPRLPDEHPNFLHGLSTRAARDAYWVSFTTIVARLRAAGKRLVILRPIPDLPVKVEHYVFAGHGGATGMTRGEEAARNGWVNARLDRLAALPGVTLLDPKEAFCDAERCVSIIGGQAMYFDDNHLSIAGARRLVAVGQARGVLP